MKCSLYFSLVSLLCSTPVQADEFKLAWQEAGASIQVSEDCRIEARHTLVLKGHQPISRSDELLLVRICLSSENGVTLSLLDVLDAFSPSFTLMDLDGKGPNELLLRAQPGTKGVALYVYKITDTLTLEPIDGANIRSLNHHIEFRETDEGIVIEALSTWHEEGDSYSKYIDRYRLIDGEIVNIQSVKTLHNTEDDE